LAFELDCRKNGSESFRTRRLFAHGALGSAILLPFVMML
jgi:hypothetical protein